MFFVGIIVSNETGYMNEARTMYVCTPTGYYGDAF